MGRRQADEHGAGLDFLPVNRFIAAHDTKRPRGGNSEPVHGLAAEILTDGGPEDRPSVVVARERCQARPLEVQVPLLADVVTNLSQKNGASIAKL